MKLIVKRYSLVSDLLLCATPQNIALLMTLATVDFSMQNHWNVNGAWKQHIFAPLIFFGYVIKIWSIWMNQTSFWKKFWFQDLKEYFYLIFWGEWGYHRRRMIFRTCFFPSTLSFWDWTLMVRFERQVLLFVEPFLQSITDKGFLLHNW